jgi:hypothetical protein
VISAGVLLLKLPSKKFPPERIFLSKMILTRRRQKKQRAFCRARKEVKNESGKVSRLLYESRRL